MADSGTGLWIWMRQCSPTNHEMDPAAACGADSTPGLTEPAGPSGRGLARIEQDEMARRLENRSEPHSCVLALVRCRGIGHPRVRGPAELQWSLGDDARGGLPGHSATMRAARPAVQPVAAVPHAPAQLTRADAAKSAAQGNDLGLTCGTYPPTGKLALPDASAVRSRSLPRQVEPAEFSWRTGNVRMHRWGEPKNMKLHVPEPRRQSQERRPARPCGTGLCEYRQEPRHLPFDTAALKNRRAPAHGLSGLRPQTCAFRGPAWPTQERGSGSGCGSAARRITRSTQPPPAELAALRALPNQRSRADGGSPGSNRMRWPAGWRTARSPIPVFSRSFDAAELAIHEFAGRRSCSGCWRRRSRRSTRTQRDDASGSPSGATCSRSPSRPCPTRSCGCG